MAQDAAGSEATSVPSTTSPTPNWWENIHMNPISSWSAMNVNNRWQQPHSNISSNNCEEKDHMSNISTTSFVTNASNRSMDSSSAELSGEPVENNLWNQVLFSVGNDGGDLHNDNIDNGENFLEVLSSKTLNPTDMFNPVCDYLKKLDTNNWDFPNHSPSLNTVGINIKQMNSVNNPTNLVEPELLTNLSDMVSTWSIAPPNPNTCNMSQIKHEMFPNSASYMPSYESIGASRAFNINTTTNSGMGYQLMGLNNSLIGLNNNKYYSGSSISDAPWSTNARSLSDFISFKGSQLSTSHCRKQGYDESSSSLQTKGSGRVSGTTSDGKKKRSEDNSETQFKKSKHNDQSSNASSIKLQTPKVKLGEKITALQQIVSPFGKTDTASVLLEAINYIRILQEQVQLLSDPYLKTSPNKDINSWGSCSSNLERKDKGETKLVDLRSRGLCLVPISCTPQIYRENSGPDYWPPTFRGSCLFR